VHCALLNVPATGLTLLLFLARNCVTSDMTGGSVGPVIMLNIFFFVSDGEACRELLPNVGFVKTYQSKMHQSCLHHQDSPHFSSFNTHLQEYKV